MFSLIITIISVALVAALALATLYYGGDTFKKGKADAEAAKILIQGQQVLAAAELYYLKNSKWPDTLQQLVTDQFLDSIPTALAPTGVLADAQAAARVWDVAAAGVPVYVLPDIDTELCKMVNKKAFGKAGVPKKAYTALSAQCFGETPNDFTVVVTKNGTNLVDAFPPDIIIIHPEPPDEDDRDGWTYPPDEPGDPGDPGDPPDEEANTEPYVYPKYRRLADYWRSGDPVPEITHTITNVTGSPLTMVLSDESIAGGHDELAVVPGVPFVHRDVAIDSTCNWPLALNQTCTIKFTFRPEYTGEQKSWVTLAKAPYVFEKTIPVGLIVKRYSDYFDGTPSVLQTVDLGSITPGQSVPLSINPPGNGTIKVPGSGAITSSSSQYMLWLEYCDPNDNIETVCGTLTGREPGSFNHYVQVVDPMSPTGELEGVVRITGQVLPGPGFVVGLPTFGGYLTQFVGGDAPGAVTDLGTLDSGAYVTMSVTEVGGVPLTGFTVTSSNPKVTATLNCPTILRDGMSCNLLLKGDVETTETLTSTITIDTNETVPTSFEVSATIKGTSQPPVQSNPVLTLARGHSNPVATPVTTLASGDPVSGEGSAMTTSALNGEDISCGYYTTISGGIWRATCAVGADVPLGETALLLETYEGTLVIPVNIVEYSPGMWPEFALDTEFTSLGNVRLGQTALATITLTNTGGAPLSGTVVSLVEPYSSSLSITSNSCSGSVAAGASCSVVVQYAPVALDPYGYPDGVVVRFDNGPVMKESFVTGTAVP